MRNPKKILNEFRNSPVPSEGEIISHWDNPEGKPMVSIVCATFNHQRYIEDAIKGFLIQKTSFPFEIIIHDDASTDRTADIIREYQDKYPKLIKPIFQTINRYSQGITISPTYIYPEVKGKYIAICEGDDFWVASFKLQKQYLLAENSTGPVLLTNSYLKLEGGELNNSVFGDFGSSTREFTAQEVLDNNAGPIGQTASFFLNLELAVGMYKVFENPPVGDFFFQVYAATHGKLIYSPWVHSVYRVNTEGSWSKTHFQSSRRIENILILIERFGKIAEGSRSYKEFSALDWKGFFANYYLRLALYYLDENAFKNAHEAVKKSSRLHCLGKRQKIMLLMSKNGVLAKLLKILIKIRSMYQVSIRSVPSSI